MVEGMAWHVVAGGDGAVEQILDVSPDSQLGAAALGRGYQPKCLIGETPVIRQHDFRHGIGFAGIVMNESIREIMACRRNLNVVIISSFELSD